MLLCGACRQSHWSLISGGNIPAKTSGLCSILSVERAINQEDLGFGENAPNIVYPPQNSIIFNLVCNTMDFQQNLSLINRKATYLTCIMKQREYY